VIGNATVIRVRSAPGGFDVYGDPVASAEARTTLEGCAVAPRSSDEHSDRGRQGVIVGLMLYAPYGTDLLFTDQIEVDGVLYNIDGEVGSWKNPLSTWEAGVEVALSRAAG
jgi:hypothetical protein